MINYVFLVGRIGQDATLNFTQSGKSVIKFSIATNDGYGENQKTNWHNIEIWNKDNLHQFLIKGTMIGVLGSLDYKEYEGKYYTTIKAWQIKLLSTKKSEGEENDDF